MAEIKCPETIEELEELERRLSLCRREIYKAHKAKMESGAACSKKEADRQLAEETGKSVETIRSYRKGEEKSKEGVQCTPPAYP